jgi:hypothetical protein
MITLKVISKTDLRVCKGGFTPKEEVKEQWFRVDAEDFEEIKADLGIGMVLNACDGPEINVPVSVT